MLRGEYVIMRVPEADDADIMAAWQNDGDVAKLLPIHQIPVSKSVTEDMISGVRRDKNKIVFVIENDDGIPIGIASLKDIDWIDGTAKMDIVLYAKNCWGRGFGYDSVRTLTDYGLDGINLNTIYVNILEGNDTAVKCFEKAGYRSEGVLQNRVLKDGRMRNIISMSITGRSKGGL